MEEKKEERRHRVIEKGNGGMRGEEEIMCRMVGRKREIKKNEKVKEENGRKKK